jgi:hypothetical protein
MKALRFMTSAVGFSMRVDVQLRTSGEEKWRCREMPHDRITGQLPRERLSVN